MSPWIKELKARCPHCGSKRVRRYDRHYFKLLAGKWVRCRACESTYQRHYAKCEACGGRMRISVTYTPRL